MESLNNKTALVTGASRGIGRGVALTLAEADIDVAVNYYQSEKQAKEVSRLIENEGVRGIPIQADVSEKSEVSKLVETVEQELGPIDILINNAGIAQTRNIEEITTEDFDKLIRTNHRSTFLVTQAVLPNMRKNGWGRIIIMSSVAAQTGGGVGLHYAASKAGQLGMMHYYARTLASEGITVNAIAPALIETDMIAKVAGVSPDIIPVKRFGSVEEVADLTLSILRNGDITNQTFNIDGGFYPR